MTLPQNWLITGGCGFIGCNLIRHLKSNTNANIRIIDNFSTAGPDDLARVTSFDQVNQKEMQAFPTNGKIQLVEGDIRDAKLAQQASKGADVIIHLAANAGVPKSVSDPRNDMECNVIGVFNYLEGARIHNVPRFVFASSAAPLGEIEPPVHEELAAHPISPYGASKLAGEGYCSAYARTYGIDTVALRFGNVYGIGSAHKTSVVAKFIKQALNNETLEIYGDGSQTRDYIYIDDLIEAILKAASIADIGGETFQIATNAETTLNELVDIMVPQLNQAGIHNVNVIHGETRLGDMPRNYSDTSKAKKMLDWKSKTDLKTGLELTINDILNTFNKAA